jgi:HAD superfamily hydrolase (TIGR01509 family)
MNPFVIFDLDDTLVDSTGAIDSWFVELAELRALGPEGLAFLRAEQQRPVSPAESFRAIVEEFGFPETPAELQRDFATRLPQLARTFVGAPDGLRALRHYGWRTALLTNGMRTEQWEKMRDLHELFDHVCYADDEPARKPDPAIFRLVADRAGESLDGAWMVGDSLTNDIAGGAAMGMSTMWVSGAQELPPDGPRPDVVVRTIAEAFPILLSMSGPGGVRPARQLHAAG